MNHVASAFELPGKFDGTFQVEIDNATGKPLPPDGSVDVRYFATLSATHPGAGEGLSPAAFGLRTAVRNVAEDKPLTFLGNYVFSTGTKRPKAPGKQR